MNAKEDDDILKSRKWETIYINALLFINLDVLQREKIRDFNLSLFLLMYPHFAFESLILFWPSPPSGYWLRNVLQILKV